MNDLTIVAIYGHTSGAEAIPALMTSMRHIKGSQGLLLSMHKPENLPSEIDWKPICQMNHLQYSVFVMHSLHEFIETDYCLIVQDDGWVVNGENFDKFYKFDYVGAPCHAAIVNNQIVNNFSWIGQKDKIVIQNGGLSLRSKKFLTAPNRLGLVHFPTNDMDLWNEDVQLSGYFRPILEANRIRFASDDVAMTFAIEYLGPGFNDHVDLNQIVGLHGQTRKLVGEKHIKVPIEAANLPGEPKILGFLEEIGYTVEYA